MALAEVWAMGGWLQRAHRCPKCTGYGCTNAPRAAIGRHRWLQCPIGALQHPYWRIIVRTHIMGQMSPMDGWPDLYPAGIVSGLLAIRQALAAERERAAREAELAAANARAAPGAPGNWRR